jgi:hypothetical protein
VLNDMEGRGTAHRSKDAGATRWVTTAIAAAVLLVLPALAPPARAQGDAGGFLGLGSGLPTVYILDRTGRETVGKLAGLTDDSIVLETGTRRQTFEATQVLRIRRSGDSLKNGAIVGALVGGPIGLLVSGECSLVRIKPPPQPVFAERTSCPGERIAMYLVYTGLVSVAGAAFDAVHTGRTNLWQAPAGGTAADPLSEIGLGFPTMYVRDRAGRETAGTLLGLTEELLVLSTDRGRQTFEPAAVTKIEMSGDSLSNGARLGAATGVVVGGLTGLLASGAACSVARSCPGKRAATFLLATTVLTGLSAAVGTVIDAAHGGRTTVWDATRTPTRTVTIGIATEPGRVAVSAVVRF